MKNNVIKLDDIRNLKRYESEDISEENNDKHEESFRAWVTDNQNYVESVYNEIISTGSEVVLIELLRESFKAGSSCGAEALMEVLKGSFGGGSKND